jgi:hypothetical protein
MLHKSFLATSLKICSYVLFTNASPKFRLNLISIFANDVCTNHPLLCVSLPYSLFRTSAGLLLAAFIVCDPIMMIAIANTASKPTNNSTICTGV